MKKILKTLLSIVFFSVSYLSNAEELKLKNEDTSQTNIIEEKVSCTLISEFTLYDADGWGEDFVVVSTGATCEEAGDNIQRVKDTLKWVEGLSE